MESTNVGQPGKPETPEMPEMPETIAIRKLDKIETTVNVSGPSGN